MKSFKPFLSLLLILQVGNAAAATLQEVSRLIEEGHWHDARGEINRGLAQPGLSFQAREGWLFESDRMARMQMDFSKTRDQIFREARQIVPSLTEELFAGYEKAGALEFLEIDGQRWFFDRAAGNMFRINAEAKALKAKSGKPLTAWYRLDDVRPVLASYDKTGQRFNTPKTSRVTYTLSVKSNAVPAGE